MRPKIIYAVLFLLTVCNKPYAQSGNQEAQMAVYNVALGGLTAGIGAVINKQKNTNWKKVFVKGFWQGSLGGALNYSAKKTLNLINQQNKKIYALPAKILHAAGLSIIENAALNEPFLQNWNINYGPVRFDFSVGHNRKFKARFLPESIYSVYKASKVASFDIKTTLLTGNLIFTNTSKVLISNRNSEVEGMSFGRSIAIGIDWIGSNWVLSHEMVHQFQYDDYQVLNTWLKPFENHIESKLLTTIFTKYVYADIPYFWFFYSAQGINKPNSYNNFYEFEAERFALNTFIVR